MSYEERDHSGFYDDNSINDPYRRQSGEPDAGTRQSYDAAGQSGYYAPGDLSGQLNGYYGGQSYYAGRRCTPMGAPKRTKRRKGALAALLVVALLAGAAFGAVQLLRQYSVLPAFGGKPVADHTDDTQEPAQPQASTDPEPGETTDDPAKSSGLTGEAAPAQESGSQPEDASGALVVDPSPKGTETMTSDAEGALSLQQIYQKLNPSVVSIISTLKSGTATGTGIIMSESGYIITNHHVIEGANQLTVLTYDDQQYTAELVGSDTISDLAVLRIEAGGLTAAEFGDSDSLRVGDSVVAIGDPLGIQLRGTMTSGIISAINRDLTVEDRKMTLIQTDAALNSGNSGGPLINCYGQVIGINTMKMSSYYSSASVEGLGFAIPIAVAKPIIDELIENGYVAGRPAIGINGESMPEYARLYYRLPKGVYVTYVSEASDAYVKGIRENDIITAVNGTAVSTIDEINTIKNQYMAGDQITLTVYRDGSYYDVSVTLMDQALQ